MLRWTEFAEKITTRGVYQIWHCNVASRVTESLEAPKKGIDLIRKLGIQKSVQAMHVNYDATSWTEQSFARYWTPPYTENILCQWRQASKPTTIYDESLEAILIRKLFNNRSTN